jgi:uncharacterized protein (DUF885 family)
MQAIFDQLGYPKDADLPALYQRVAQDGGFAEGEQIAKGYETLIAEAKDIYQPVFNLFPQADVVVLPDPYGGYYMPPAVDGSRPGAFYARVSGTEVKYIMPTLLYHETVPGHHFQIAIARELDLPMFRNHTDFMGYVEGWALYAERLMAELDAYKDNPYGNLGRLQFDAYRAVRLVVDTGIHAKKWSYDQAVNYMVENTGFPKRRVEYEICRYIAWPGQATSYMVGMLKILELREQAKAQLGEEFDLKEFHNVVLKNGAMPLTILEQVVQAYITQRKQS